MQEPNPIEVAAIIGPDLQVHPSPAVVYGGEEIVWCSCTHRCTVVFDDGSPFGESQFEVVPGELKRSGPHIHKINIKKFKYTVTRSDGGGSVDPDVEADPRRRPKYS